MAADKKSFSPVEFIVACVIIFVLVGVGTVYFKNILKSYREIALKNQLANVRLSIKLYQLLQNKSPEDLRQLLIEEVDLMPYSGGVFKKRYLESVRSDKENFPLDPFGNRFVYRPDICEVRSSTKGYENW